MLTLRIKYQIVDAQDRIRHVDFAQLQRLTGAQVLCTYLEPVAQSSADEACPSPGVSAYQQKREILALLAQPRLTVEQLLGFRGM